MTASSFGPHGEPKFADDDAPDVALNPTEVAAYAAKVGNRRIGTTAERTAATGKDVWDGLLWFDTTEKKEYRHDGTVFRARVKHAEFTMLMAGVPDGATVGAGTVAIVPASSTDTAFVASAAGGVQIKETGVYVIDVSGNLSGPATGRTFVDIATSDSKRTMGQAGEDAIGGIRTLYVVTAPLSVTVNVFKTNGGTNNVSGRIRVTKVG